MSEMTEQELIAEALAHREESQRDLKQQLRETDEMRREAVRPLLAQLMQAVDPKLHAYATWFNDGDFDNGWTLYVRLGPHRIRAEANIDGDQGFAHWIAFGFPHGAVEAPVWLNDHNSVGWWNNWRDALADGIKAHEELFVSPPTSIEELLTLATQHYSGAVWSDDEQEHKHARTGALLSIAASARAIAGMLMEAQNG